MNRDKVSVAKVFLEYFQANDLIGLGKLLHKDFQFKGPLYEAHSARDYLRALENDPPETCTINIEEVFSNNEAVCIVYGFEKPIYRYP